ncbi:hypothetical protein ASG49_16900 [Marmoricola sp. Leaf446]|nr:hypothetical protein ASG49_16900 [Marmoricola sp. Leaf446]
MPDLAVTPDPTPHPTPDPPPGSLSRRRWASGLAVAVVLPTLLSAGLVVLDDRLDLATQALLLVLPTVVAALVGGLAPAVVAAVLGSVLLAYLFTPPERTWEVAGATNVVGLVVQLAVGLSTAAAVDLAARRARQAEEAETRRRALAAVDRTRTALLAAVGHDLRTPLAAAGASIATLRSDDLRLSDANTAELLEGAQQSLDRLGALVADLLDVSRLRAGAMAVVLQPVDLEEVCARALDDLAAAATVTLGRAADVPDVRADPGLLERVVVNLVANALRHTPGGRPPRLVARRTDGMVELRVVDHGPGIPAERREEVFAPFQRLGDTDPASGIGLGLALSRGLVEAMGGTLLPEDTPGGGLTMVVALRPAPGGHAGLVPGRRERGETPEASP